MTRSREHADMNDDDITVKTDNTKTMKINIDKEYGISDTGATGYFFRPRSTSR